jgi:hypothetical protein
MKDKQLKIHDMKASQHTWWTVERWDVWLIELDDFIFISVYLFVFIFAVLFVLLRIKKGDVI